MADLECTMDEQEVVVIDSGSGYLKIGLSGEDAPRAVIPTSVGTVGLSGDREDSLGQGGGLKSRTLTLFGNDIYKYKPPVNGEDGAVLEIPRISVVNPVQRARVINEEQLEALWEHAFKERLRVEPEELPVLLTDSPLYSAATRSWMAEVMIEKFRVRSLSIMNTSALALFSTGLATGLVIECGEGISQAVPVFEGYAIPHAIFTADKAGMDITSQLGSLLAANGKSLEAEAFPSRVLSTMKEKLCRVAPRRDFEYLKAGSRQPPDDDQEARSFELPDGTIIEVPHFVRLGAPEVLFSNPTPDGLSILDSAHAPKVEGKNVGTTLQEICADAIATVDSDLREKEENGGHELVRSVVLSGGSFLLPNVAERLRTELTEGGLNSGPMIDSELLGQLSFVVDSQRRYASWVGGSMFASLSTFHHLSITRQDYEEGKQDIRALVARKTF